MENENRNKFKNNEKFLNLDEILKEKILYDNICFKHNLLYSKYCSSCKNDICTKCETQYHINHEIINYEKLLFDMDEKNMILKNVKRYINDNNIFMNEINELKNKFNNLLNEYKIRINNIIEFFQNFNPEKLNFNLIYKHRLIFDIFSEYYYSNMNNSTNENNTKVIKIMEKYIKSTEKQNIKNDIQLIIKTLNKLKEFIKYRKLNNSISITFNKIIDIIDIKQIKKDFNNFSNKFINKHKQEEITDITPNLNNKIIKNSSINNKETSASSWNNNIYNKYISKNNYNKKYYNNTIESIELNNEEYRTSKSMNNININKLNCFGIYERKKIRQKSMDYSNIHKKVNILKEFDNNNIISNLNNEKDKKIKMNENFLKNAINATKILSFKNKKSNPIKEKFNKTQNFINKTVFNNYNNFQNNIKSSRPDAFNITSYSNKRSKNVSQLFKYNNSLDNININKNIDNLSKIYKKNQNNNIFLINNNNDKERKISIFTLGENDSNNEEIGYNRNTTNTKIDHYGAKNYHSVENIIKGRVIKGSINKKNNINNDDFRYNQTYNNKLENNIYVHKRFISLDMSKSLSSFESNTNSIISSTSSKKNNFSDNSLWINKWIMNNTNKTNFNNKLRKSKLYLGLEIGNTECKIGINNDNNNFKINKNFTYLNIPTIISFTQNVNDLNQIDVKIGKEAEKLQFEKYDQTIYNIIKLFGKNSNEIFGKKELWPFNIYNDLNHIIKESIIKIKCSNKEVYYSIEDILCIYLKRVLEMFFDKLSNNNLEEKSFININITVSVPNYFNYTQRALLKKIFTINLFPKRRNNKYNIYSKYYIELDNLYIESISNLISYSLFNSYNFQQNKNIYDLILCIDGCSTNLSLVKLSKTYTNNFIEIKYINSAEFGENDFLDNLIESCLNQFEEKIKNICLNSPLILAKIRKAINDTKKKFDNEEIEQIEVNINRLFGNIDLKINIKIDNYYSISLDFFTKIIFLIKDTIINSGIDICKINDIILIGNMSHNIKLKKMISELFKERNKYIYNKLINESNKNSINNKEQESYILKGAIIHCLNKSISFPEYKITNISPSSIGIEGFNDQMEFYIKKGDYIPIRLNKFIKIKKPINNVIIINIYEGENKNVKNNKLLSNNSIDINNLINVKKEEKYVELLIQIFMDSNYNLSVYILDRNTYKRQYECLI